MMYYNIKKKKGAALKYKELEKILKSCGWYFFRAGKGSHMLWMHEKAEVPLPIPNHGGKELNPDLVKGLLKKIRKTAEQ